MQGESHFPTDCLQPPLSNITSLHPLNVSVVIRNSVFPLLRSALLLPYMPLAS